MRVGLLTTSFPRHERDIAGAFVLGFARALVAQGHSVEVLAPEPRELIPAPSWPGISVHWVPYMRPRDFARTFYADGVPDNLRRDPLAWLGLAPFTLGLLRESMIRRAGWDALCSHWALPCGLVAGAVRESRPHLGVLHSADLHLLARLPARRALALQLWHTSSRLVLVSDAQRARFAALLPSGQVDREELSARCVVQPMGVEADGDGDAPLQPPEREALRERLGLQRFTLLTLARLVPIKGLVEAASQLAGRADLEWLIGGDGPERERLAALASHAKLRVRLLGTVTGQAKRDVLRAADAFVLPSRVLASGRSEGAPTVLLEAMAHGLPVIASDVGGVGALVSHMHSGLLFDHRAPGALAACIDRVRCDPPVTALLTAQGRLTANRHRWSAIGPRLDALLRNQDPDARVPIDAPGSARAR